MYGWHKGGGCEMMTHIKREWVGGGEIKGGATNLKVGGQNIGRWGGQYSKNPKNLWGRMTRPPPQVLWWHRRGMTQCVLRHLLHTLIHIKIRTRNLNLWVGWTVDARKGIPPAQENYYFKNSQRASGWPNKPITSKSQSKSGLWKLISYFNPKCALLIETVDIVRHRHI